MASTRLTKKERIAHYVDRIKETIRSKHPEAQFLLTPGEERETWDLLTYTNAADDFEIIDLTVRLVADIDGREPFSIYVIPMPLSVYRGNGQSERAA